uniref:CHHC U11-48K-type domain-containing protein n=1 Tax=Timema poppense TaxID=170557 RepID=A0A7R9CZJ6_TIMPO|nr:unnamed protein product [Timema poppensis]
MQTHDPLVQCPFEKSHMIFKSRLITHLTKCQKNHMGEGKIPCPLNATHFVQEQLMTYHMSFECTDRGDIERLHYQIETPATTYFPPVEEPTLPPAEENWDSFDAPTYDLEQALSERAPVLRSLNVAPNNSDIKKLKEKLNLKEIAKFISRHILLVCFLKVIVAVRRNFQRQQRLIFSAGGHDNIKPEPAPIGVTLRQPRNDANAMIRQMVIGRGQPVGGSEGPTLAGSVTSGAMDTSVPHTKGRGVGPVKKLQVENVTSIAVGRGRAVRLSKPDLHNIMVHPKWSDPATNNNSNRLHQPKGSYPCNKPRCNTCKIHQRFTSLHSRLIHLEYPMTCSTENVLYQLQCNYCIAENINLSTGTLGQQHQP